jgi:SAM-dependent methyltransferase
MTKSNSLPWYKQAFGDDYLWLYSHRSEDAAESEVLSAIEHLPFQQGQEILDVACGAGRHMLAFSRNGALVTGVDLSETLLANARERLRVAGMQAMLVRADMRCLPFSERFDGVTMWFTSFGYFRTMADDLKALKSIASVLKKDGWWWIDIPNPAHLARNLVPVTEREIDGPNGLARVTERRRIANGRVIKNIEIEDSLGKRSFVERVRLYSPEKFGALAKRAGLTAHGILGDYDGSPLTPDMPRQIWYGVKL